MKFLPVVIIGGLGLGAYWLFHTFDAIDIVVTVVLVLFLLVAFAIFISGLEEGTNDGQ